MSDDLKAFIVCIALPLVVLGAMGGIDIFLTHSSYSKCVENKQPDCILILNPNLKNK